MATMTDPAPPRSAGPIAAGGLVLVAIALVLLAVGGTFTASDPTTFDLWVLAVGLFVLGGSLAVIARRAPEPAPLPGVPMASLPSLSPGRFGIPPTPTVGFEPPDLPGTSRPQGPVGAVSDTIAGQYYGLARDRPGAHGPLRRPAQRTEDEIGLAPALPFTPAVRRSSTVPEPPEPRNPPAPPTDPALAGEVARLSNRVSELERSDLGRPAWPSPLTIGVIGACGGCGRAMPPGTPSLSCPSCGRPLCATCDGLAVDGPRAHWCPDCRARAEGRSPTDPDKPWVEPGPDR